MAAQSKCDAHTTHEKIEQTEWVIGKDHLQHRTHTPQNKTVESLSNAISNCRLLSCLRDPIESHADADDGEELRCTVWCTPKIATNTIEINWGSPQTSIELERWPELCHIPLSVLALVQQWHQSQQTNLSLRFNTSGDYDWVGIP